NYAAALGVLPPAGTASRFAPQAMLLPYLEQKPVFDAINFQGDPTPLEGTPNATAAATSLDVFLCPADREPAGTSGWTSYAANGGNGRGGAGRTGPSAPDAAAAVVAGLQDVPDGTSLTAAMAEWLLGPGRPDDRVPGRSIAELSGGGPLPPSVFAASC